MTLIKVILSSFYNIFTTDDLVIKIVNCIIRIRDKVHNSIIVLKMIVTVCRLPR